MANSKILVVTGASKGIGKATAQMFLNAGYQVINLSRTNCDIEGVNNIAWNLASTDWSKQRELLINALPERCEMVLLHNAAMMTKETVTDMKDNVLREVLELNVIAPARLNTLLIPHMQENSSIIYISSTLGTKAVANTHAYVISKHAAIGQMRATCQDLAGKQIHTAAICPGFTETEMLSEHLGANPELREQIASNIALGRIAQPIEIAETIFFASQNPVINGTIIDANLGQIES
jgi:Dehydrogenases with different specificities (related to short-chain alcohol dehydrogenases)